MKIPNVERAVVSPEKIRDYLLNPEHRRGGPKARLLIEFGYRRDHWQQLSEDLRTQHVAHDVDRVIATDYGVRYEIHAPLVTPIGRTIMARSIWQIDTGTDAPRLITMHPD